MAHRFQCAIALCTSTPAAALPFRHVKLPENRTHSRLYLFGCQVPVVHLVRCLALPNRFFRAGIRNRYRDGPFFHRHIIIIYTHKAGRIIHVEKSP